MSMNTQTKNLISTTIQLTQIDEKKKLVSSILKRVDHFIKAKEFQKAFLEISNAKDIDPTNVYALALEERIKTLQKEELEKSKKVCENAGNTTTANDLNKTRNDSVTINKNFPINSGSIPPKNDESNRKEPIHQPVTPNTNVNTTIRKPKVVLIDDDDALLSVLSMTIESGGFEVISLSTSDEAFVLLNKLVPDIIVCDINLETSTMGGFTFYEKIRQNEKLRNIPFVFLTGLNDDVLIRTGKEMGVDDYLTKPIKEQNLLASIRGRIKRYEELGLRHSTQNFCVNVSPVNYSNQAM